MSEPDRMKALEADNARLCEVLIWIANRAPPMEEMRGDAPALVALREIVQAASIAVDPDAYVGSFGHDGRGGFFG